METKQLTSSAVREGGRGGWRRDHNLKGRKRKKSAEFLRGSTCAPLRPRSPRARSYVHALRPTGRGSQSGDRAEKKKGFVCSFLFLSLLLSLSFLHPHISSSPPFVVLLPGHPSLLATVSSLSYLFFFFSSIPPSRLYHSQCAV